MRSVVLVLATLAAVGSDAHAGRGPKPAPPSMRPVVAADGGKTLEAADARGIAASFLRGSRKYGLPSDIELHPGEVTRIAPTSSTPGDRPVTGAGGFAIVHETRGTSPTRFLTLVDGNGKAHDAGSSPVVLQEKVRSRLSFGSLLTGQNLTQAGLTVGLGLLQIPNFIGGGQGANATTALTGATLALLIGNTTKLFFDASRAHRDGVVQSISQSVQFIKDRQDPATRTAGYPTLAETYVFYKQKLEELSPGAVPIPLADFSERVSAYGF